MAYTKDYYRILSLDRPSWRPAKQSTTTADVRRAYKAALLSAHPDKQQQQQQRCGDDNNGRTKSKPRYTVDDIKEAYTILADAKTRADYDTWFLHNYNDNYNDNYNHNHNHNHNRRQRHGDTLGCCRRNSGGHEDDDDDDDAHTLSSDFILGLEVLDLSEFRVVEQDREVMEHASVSASNSDSDSESEPESLSSFFASERRGKREKEEKQKQQQQQTRWTRECRCGTHAGFSILEQQLEDALQRGRNEVLVGCQGCSLWVRVGFEVEEDVEEDEEEG
ncbi:hypothetical protein ACJQWK_09635 [Exserohilum turcicum]